MHSFLTVMPGETTSCIGCHEQRTRAPMSIGANSVLALRRPAQKITPIPGIPEVFDYPRDIQPILDKHCIKCHDYDQPVTVFADTGDPDYQKILAMCTAGKNHLEKIKRFDMPGFTPIPQYVREMQRFGIITDTTTPIAPYSTDQAYWRSLWCEPPTQ